MENNNKTWISFFQEYIKEPLFSHFRYLSLFLTIFLTLITIFISFLVFVFRWALSNVICNLLLYLQSKSLTISWIYRGTVPFQYLILAFAIRYSTLSLAAKSLFSLTVSWRRPLSYRNQPIDLRNIFLVSIW